jgi:DNA polymerase-3 subunit beta
VSGTKIKRIGDAIVSNATMTTAAPTGNLEITVSRAELLRELTAAQSVVERKTTIPILSNFLFEASEGETDGR